MPQGLCHRTMLLLLLYCVWFFLKPLACGSVGVCDVNCCSSTYKIICILSASKARGAWVWPSLALVCRSNDRQCSLSTLSIFLSPSAAKKEKKSICMHFSVQRLQHFRCLFCTPLFAPLMRNINISLQCTYWMLLPLWLSLCQAHNLFLINKLNIGKLFPAGLTSLKMFSSRRARMLAERGILILDCWNFSHGRSFFTELRIFKLYCS